MVTYIVNILEEFCSESGKNNYYLCRNEWPVVSCATFIIPYLLYFTLCFLLFAIPILSKCFEFEIPVLLVMRIAHQHLSQNECIDLC